MCKNPPKLPLFSRGLKNLVNTPMCKICMSPPPSTPSYSDARRRFKHLYQPSIFRCEATIWVRLSSSNSLGTIFLCLWLSGAEFVVHVCVEVWLPLGVCEGEERTGIVRLL